MKIIKKIIFSLLCLAFICLVLYFLFLLSKSRTFQFFGGLTNRVDTDQKVIALTFDDAPTSKTEDVLKILSDNNAKATFYVIGQNIEQFPQQAKSIALQGHELGNHSYSHKRIILKSQSFINNEITKTNDLIRDTGYSGDITFRPPNGKKFLGLPCYLWKNKIKTVMWDVEPDTYVAGDSKRIVEYTLDNVKPGSIILIHPFCDSYCEADRKALPEIISRLKAEDYTFVTVSELLKYKQ